MLTDAPMPSPIIPPELTVREVCEGNDAWFLFLKAKEMRSTWFGGFWVVFGVIFHGFVRFDGVFLGDLM